MEYGESRDFVDLKDFIIIDPPEKGHDTRLSGREFSRNALNNGLRSTNAGHSFPQMFPANYYYITESVSISHKKVTRGEKYVAERIAKGTRLC